MTAATPLLEGVFARRLERLTLVTRQRLVGQGQGDRRSRRKGQSLEFADYRHYVPGDDTSRVDWNIYGRTGSLFVRVYEEEEVLNVHLFLDASRSMDWGEPNKLDYARRVAAALGYVALSSSNRLHVRPLNAGPGAFGPAWGRGRAGPLLSFLEGVRPEQATTPIPIPGVTPAPPELDQPLGRAAVRTSGLAIFISDLLSPTWEAAIGRIAAAQGNGVVLHALSPQELRPALGGDVRLVDRETGATVPVTMNTDAIRLYGERLNAWREKVESYCARHNLGYVLMDTEVPLETFLFDTLRRRGVVR